MAWPWPARWTRSPPPPRTCWSATRAARPSPRSRCSALPCAPSPTSASPSAAATCRPGWTVSPYPCGRLSRCAKAKRSPLAAAGLGRGPFSPSQAASRSPPFWAAAPPSCAPVSAASRAALSKRATSWKVSASHFLTPSAACAPPTSPEYAQPAVLRVLPGPHSSAFTGEGLDTLFSSFYTVSPQSDRQGYRLSGPAVARASAADILSEAMPWGGVQVPPDGSPILLMADRQTTGGYPLVAVVISADLPRAGQLAPGDAVRFESVTLAEAHEAALRQEHWLRAVEGAGLL